MSRYETGHLLFVSRCVSRCVSRYETQRDTVRVLYRKQTGNDLFPNGTQELYARVCKCIYLIRPHSYVPLRNRAVTLSVPLGFALCVVTGQTAMKCARSVLEVTRQSAAKRFPTCTLDMPIHIDACAMPSVEGRKDTLSRRTREYEKRKKHMKKI